MIKNWKQFNESRQLDFFEGTPYDIPKLVEKGIWILTKEELEDQFMDFVDNNWDVSIFYGFYSEEYDIDSLITDRNVIPMIRVYIDDKKGCKGGSYLTNSLLSSIERLQPKFKTIKVSDEGGVINPKDLKFEDGSIYIKSDSDNIEDELEIEGRLSIDLIWIKEIYLTDKMIFQYYEFDKDFKEGDLEYEGENVIVGYPVSEIKDWVLDKKSDFKDIVGDTDKLDSDLYYDDSVVDDDSIFSYYFDSGTKRLLLEKCIGQNFKSFQEDFDFLYDYNSLEDLIQATIKGGWHTRNLFSELGEMLSETTDVYDELKQMYDDYYNSAKKKDDYDAIMSSFHQIVEDVLGTPIVEEYEKDYKTWYKLKFKFEWLEYEDDPEYIKKEGLEHIISNWCYKNYNYRKLNPRFSDSADVDRKKYNLECKEILSKLS
jgi:hypothetical protein